MIRSLPLLALTLLFLWPAITGAVRYQTDVQTAAGRPAEPPPGWAAVPAREARPGLEQPAAHPSLRIETGREPAADAPLGIESGQKPSLTIETGREPLLRRVEPGRLRRRETAAPSAAGPPVDVPVWRDRIPAPVPAIALPPGTRGVLLLGSDRREENRAWRTDTMVLAYLEPQGRRVSLISLPRDLWVYALAAGQPSPASTRSTWLAVPPSCGPP